MRQRNRSIAAGSMFDSIPRMLPARLLVLATGICPSFVISFASSAERGRREDRVRAAPAVSCAMGIKENAHEQTGLAEAVRPSLRNGLTAYAVLSLVTGFLTPSPPAGVNPPGNLTPALGASGPHGFAGAIPAVRPHALARGDGANAHHSLPPRS